MRENEKKQKVENKMDKEKEIGEKRNKKETQTQKKKKKAETGKFERGMIVCTKE